jgi:predicted Zn-dependent protease
VVAGTQAATLQGQLNYSRDMEREADRIGFGVLTTAGYAPSGMAAMFEKMENANRLNDSGAFPYLRTHPLTLDRISESRARVLQSGPGTKADPLLHQLMAARARVLMDTSVPHLRQLQARLGEPAALDALTPSGRLAALYAGAMAALQLGDVDAAAAALAQAQPLLQGSAAASPGAELGFTLLRAEVDLRQGRAAPAVAALAAVPAPASRALLLARGQAALALARSDPAAAGPELQRSAEALRSWVALQRQDPLAWELLGQTDDALGRPLRAMRAQAEARAAIGDLNGAIDRLRAAQTLARSGSANDFIEASVIDARLRDLLNQRRQLAEELRARGGRQPTPD